MEHIPVLLHEIQEAIVLHPGNTVVDATLGGAGYAKSFAEVIGETGTLIGIDQDRDALARAEKRLADFTGTLHLIEGNFRNMQELVAPYAETVDAVVFDLGVSSFQLGPSGRGLSFQHDEPLLMTFAKEPKEDQLTAEMIINTWSEESLANVFFGYGEERYARKIARRVVEVREEERIATSGRLAEIVAQVVPARGSRRHPATRVFQALRIAVNDELASLEDGLAGALSVLKPGGHIAVVSFHSLEDRIVKQQFRVYADEGLGVVVTKKPITPSDTEVAANSRARSAKLRIFTKTKI